MGPRRRNQKRRAAPAAAARGRPAVQRPNQHNVDSGDDSDDDGSIPPLIPRGNDHNDSSSYESGDSDDDDSIPPLIGRRHDPSDSEDGGDSTSTGSLPGLVARPDSRSGSSTEDGNVPAAGFPRFRPPTHESDDDDDDSDEPPPLQARNNLESSSSEDDGSLPGLARREHKGSDSSDDESIPDLIMREKTDYSSEEEDEEEKEAKRERLFPNQLVRADMFLKWKEEARALKMSVLKGKLKEMGTRIVFSGKEKSELVEEYAILKAEKESENDWLECSKKSDPEQQRRIQEVKNRIKKKKVQHLRSMLQTEFQITRPSASRGELEQEYAEAVVRAEQAANAKGPAAASEDDAVTRAVQARFSPRQLRQKLRDMQQQHAVVKNTQLIHSHADLARYYRWALRNQQQQQQEQESDNSNHTMPPALVAVQDLPKTGAWVLAPAYNGATLELTYAYPDGRGAIQKTDKLWGTFPDDDHSRLVPAAAPGSIWVYYLSGTNSGEEAGGGNIFAVDQLRETGLRVPMYNNLPGAIQVVTNGKNGVWVLTKADFLVSSDAKVVGGSTPTKDESSNLLLFDEHNLDGMQFRSPVPRSARLFMDVLTGGVWVLVPPSNSKIDTSSSSSVCPLQSGLWHINAHGEAKRVVSDVHQDALVASDSARRGILLLEPAANKHSKLLHLVVVDSSSAEQPRRRREQDLNVPFSDVQSLLDDGTKNRALVHYKKKGGGGGWKLAKATFGETAITDQYKCPKNAKISTTGQGAVWVLKKTGKGTFWGLQYLYGAHSVEESAEKYAVGSFLGGSAFDP